jgi:Ca2+-binding EF-hand superfamily protein
MDEIKGLLVRAVINRLKILQFVVENPPSGVVDETKIWMTLDDANSLVCAKITGSKSGEKVLYFDGKYQKGELAHIINFFYDSDLNYLAFGYEHIEYFFNHMLEKISSTSIDIQTAKILLSMLENQIALSQESYVDYSLKTDVVGDGQTQTPGDVVIEAAEVAAGVAAGVAGVAGAATDAVRKFVKKTEEVVEEVLGSAAETRGPTKEVNEPPRKTGATTKSTPSKRAYELLVDKITPTTVKEVMIYKNTRDNYHKLKLLQIFTDDSTIWKVDGWQIDNNVRDLLLGKKYIDKPGEDTLSFIVVVFKTAELDSIVPTDISIWLKEAESLIPLPQPVDTLNDPVNEIKKELCVATMLSYTFKKMALVSQQTVAKLFYFMKLSHRELVEVLSAIDKTYLTRSHIKTAEYCVSTLLILSLLNNDNKLYHTCELHYSGATKSENAHLTKDGGANYTCYFVSRVNMLSDLLNKTTDDRAIKLFMYPSVPFVEKQYSHCLLSELVSTVAVTTTSSTASDVSDPLLKKLENIDLTDEQRSSTIKEHERYEREILQINTELQSDHLSTEQIEYLKQQLILLNLKKKYLHDILIQISDSIATSTTPGIINLNYCPLLLYLELFQIDPSFDDVDYFDVLKYNFTNVIKDGTPLTMKDIMDFMKKYGYLPTYDVQSIEDDIDTDHDNKISESELKHQVLTHYVHEDCCQALFRDYDTDSDGFIDFDEFMAFFNYMGIKSKQTEPCIKQMFVSLDTNKDRKISYMEFKSLFQLQ